jgi:hypothetical protein
MKNKSTSFWIQHGIDQPVVKIADVQDWYVDEVCKQTIIEYVFDKQNARRSESDGTIRNNTSFWIQRHAGDELHRLGSVMDKDIDMCRNSCVSCSIPRIDEGVAFRKSNGVEEEPIQEDLAGEKLVENIPSPISNHTGNVNTNILNKIINK